MKIQEYRQLAALAEKARNKELGTFYSARYHEVSCMAKQMVIFLQRDNKAKRDARKK